MSEHSAGGPVEFSRPVAADRVDANAVTERIVATAAECRALAARFELIAIDRLSATVRLRRVRGGAAIEVSGALEADVVQTCVVSLEPLSSHVEDAFSALYAPPALVPTGPEVDVDPEDDVPEPFVAGRIDIGELTAQHLSLALDPYPRRPGAALVAHGDEARGPGAAETGPFAALAQLKRPR